MKSLFRNVAVFTFGLLVAGAITSCHRGDDVPAKSVTKAVTPTNTVRGVVLDGNGANLPGAAYSIRKGTTVVASGTCTENVFTANLEDGTYVIEVTKAGYKDADGTVKLAVQAKTLEDGTVSLCGQNAEKVFYLKQEVKSKNLTFGDNSGANDQIAIETTEQNDGTGNVVTTTDENKDGSADSNKGTIEVKASIPGVKSTDYSASATKSDYDVLNDYIKTNYPGKTIDNLTFFLTNVASLEDAKEVAQDNNVPGAARATRATTALPGGYELLAAMAINAADFDIDFAALGLPTRITLDFLFPDAECKGAVKLYRTFTGDAWTEVPLSGAGVPSDIVISQTSTGITLTISRLRTQSFALGVQIGKTEAGSQQVAISAEPVYNLQPSEMEVEKMTYTAKAGAVVTNETNSYLVDFLRKIVLSKSAIKVVKDATVTKDYVFTPAYVLPAYGTLYLVGTQEEATTRWYIINTSAAFKIVKYGDEFIYPYAIYNIPEDEPEPEPVPVHSGGSSL